MSRKGTKIKRYGSIYGRGNSSFIMLLIMATGVVAFGVAARVSQNAIDEARERGIKVGMIRPITVWPFPKEALLKAADKCKAFVSVELNMGQMIEDIELSIRCKRPVLLSNRSGGMIPTTEDVVAKIEEAAKIGG